jgi:hypothetical protein
VTWTDTWTVRQPSVWAKLWCRVFGHNTGVRGLVKTDRRWCSRCGARMAGFGEVVTLTDSAEGSDT